MLEKEELEQFRAVIKDELAPLEQDISDVKSQSSVMMHKILDLKVEITGLARELKKVRKSTKRMDLFLDSEHSKLAQKNADLEERVDRIETNLKLAPHFQ